MEAGPLRTASTPAKERFWNLFLYYPNRRLFSERLQCITNVSFQGLVNACPANGVEPTWMTLLCENRGKGCSRRGQSRSFRERFNAIQWGITNSTIRSQKKGSPGTASTWASGSLLVSEPFPSERSTFIHISTRIYIYFF